MSIHSDAELEAAQEVMDRLLAQGELSSGEELYLDALSDLVGAYEDDHFAIAPASDADLLRHLMEAKGVNQIELHRSTKIARSTISEILSGKKPFSRQIIGTLADYFGVHKTVLANNL
ncbi:helix-turn-helix domain-containing protein [Blastopirellula sp. J2-11]|uniref:helix-turn-helix domain-containing protein n=1 Tax=Blastopirellula sp. J2-11 TaxID=2943192 RepID=UPI0021C7254F|nr:helix-turn-helix domain-containing protein [Blastopirellula sp. J2-11]UUO05035.1 helix-turn-helix domain-containing protein [Blastopirellula sp. J2-11]